MYVCGGHDGIEYLASAERYDVAAGVWEDIAPMTERRIGAVAVHPTQPF